MTTTQQTATLTKAQRGQIIGSRPGRRTAPLTRDEKIANIRARAEQQLDGAWSRAGTRAQDEWHRRMKVAWSLAN